MKQNDIRESIKYFKHAIVVTDEILSDCSAKLQEELTEQKEYFEVAISALEKQLPQPPEHKVHEKYKTLGKNYYCSCGVMFVDFERNGTNYCGNCGQALKEAD